MTANPFTVIPEHYLTCFPKVFLTSLDHIILFGLLFTIDCSPGSIKLMLMYIKLGRCKSVLSNREANDF